MRNHAGRKAEEKGALEVSELVQYGLLSLIYAYVRTSWLDCSETHPENRFWESFTLTVRRKKGGSPPLYNMDWSERRDSNP